MVVVFGRFGQQDIDLLMVLANQAAAALENANWTQSLEEKVAARTAELTQRNAELAVINAVAEEITNQLDFDEEARNAITISVVEAPASTPK